RKGTSSSDHVSSPSHISLGPARARGSHSHPPVEQERRQDHQGGQPSAIRGNRHPAAQQPPPQRILAAVAPTARAEPAGAAAGLPSAGKKGRSGAPDLSRGALPAPGPEAPFFPGQPGPG